MSNQEAALVLEVCLCTLYVGQFQDPINMQCHGVT